MVWGQKERTYLKQVQLCTILLGKAEIGFDSELASVYNIPVAFMMYLK